MPTNSERIALAERYVVAARAIGEHSKVRFAQQIWYYFLTRACIRMPYVAKDIVEGQVVKWVGGKELSGDPTVLSVLPLFSGDALQNVRRYMSCYYMPVTHAVILRADDADETDFVRGCWLLHEAGRAYRADLESRIRAPARTLSITDWLQEEVDLHMLRGCLWRERGGINYGRILDEAASWVATKMRKPEEAKFFEVPNEPRWLRILEAALGRCPNPRFAIPRWLEFSIQASFTAIDAQEQKESVAEKEKQHVLQEVYDRYPARTRKNVVS